MVVAAVAATAPARMIARRLKYRCGSVTSSSRDLILFMLSIGVIHVNVECEWVCLSLPLPIKSIKVSRKNPDRLVIGADSVISLNNELINKPNSREEAFNILKKLNNSKHYLISSVCISKNGAMIWNHSDSSELKMKDLTDKELSEYLTKIETKTLLAYGVYQIEADGLELFEYINGDKDSIMGLPIKNIMSYIEQFKK